MASGKAQPSFGVGETGWVAVETVIFTAFRACGGLHFAVSSSKATTTGFFKIFPRFHGRKHCWKYRFKTENWRETKNKNRQQHFRKNISFKQVDHRIIDLYMDVSFWPVPRLTSELRWMSIQSSPRCKTRQGKAEKPGFGIFWRIPSSVRCVNYVFFCCFF